MTALLLTEDATICMFCVVLIGVTGVYPYDIIKKRGDLEWCSDGR